MTQDADATHAPLSLQAPPATNLVDYLERCMPMVDGKAICQTVELRRRENSPADAKLFFSNRGWLSSPAGAEFLASLNQDPIIGEARLKGGSLLIRFREESIETLGAHLESGSGAGLDTSDILAGKSYMVGFAGPNTSKALHIGHLRNISIGNALAAALGAAGAGSIRQSLVGDIGRNICEAMAGYTRFHDGEDPVVSGVKPDHFIGKCYARYIREFCAAPSPAGNAGDPIARELEVAGDQADIYMQRWLSADPDTRMLWSRIREWVLQGHRDTLSRFGVEMERHDFESDGMSDVAGILEEGVRRGVLEREPDGAIIYRSGREEFETMLLARSDGFPTEHARLLAVYYRMIAERNPGATYIDLAGTEWQPAAAIHEELLRRIRPDADNSGHIFLFHAMVTLRNAKMSSSDGGAPLLDDLLDQLAEFPEIQSVAESSGGAVDSDMVSDIVIKSFFLCRPHMKPMEFSWDLLTRTDNPGWTIARAWCRAMAPDGNNAPHLDPDLYRLAVIRSQDFRRNLQDAATTFNLSGLASYLVHFSEDFLRAPDHPKMKRLARTVLHRCLLGLGLISSRHLVHG